MPVVGRGVERDVLRAALDRARAGTGSVALVTGPAGIGKTRLLEQLATDAASAGVPVVWGRCPAERSAPPLWPWTRALEGAGAPPPDVLDAASSAPPAGSPAAEDTAAVQILLAAAVTDALASTAAREGLVVVLEDLHWADSASLLVLRHLAADVRRTRLLVVASARDSDGRGLPVTVADLVPLPGVELLSLGPLPAAGVAAYLSAAAGRAVDPGVVALVHERSGGNPLYVRTLARVLGPDLGGAGLTREELSRQLVASSEVRLLVAAALRPLDSGVLDLLRVASVLAEEIEPALLAGVAEQPREDVETMLDVAGRAGLLDQVPGGAGRRRFAHALVRDGVLAGLPPATRRRWHVRAASLLETAAAVRPDLAGEVAHHWLNGADTPEQQRRAVGWAQTAAARARQHAPEEAARLLQQARVAGDRAGLDDAERAALLVELATAEYAAGDVASSLEHSGHAADLAESAGRPDLLADAALVLRGIGHSATTPALIDLCGRALAAGPQPPATVALLTAQRALAQAQLGRVDLARADAVAALAAAEECNDQGALLLAVHACVDTLDALSPPEQRRALADRALALPLDARQPLTRLWALLWRLVAAYQAADAGDIQEGIARLEGLVTRLPLPLARWHLLRVRAAHAALAGDLPGARTWNDEAAEVPLQDPTGRGMSTAFRACLALLTGDPAELGQDWFAGIDRAPDIPVTNASKAAVLLLLGRGDEAETLYRRVMAGAAALPRDGRWNGTLDALVDVAEGLGDAEGARVLHELVLPAAPWAGGPASANMLSSGSGWRRVARTAALLGQRRDAITAFEQALSVDVGLGARPAAVHDRLGLAELLADEDVGRARTLASQAAAEARAIGLPGPLRRADQLMGRLCAPPADLLTAREHEVAALVARSLSNREIATQLVLSERTVESHVRNILAKLGLTRRTEIVRWELTSPGDGSSSRPWDARVCSRKRQRAVPPEVVRHSGSNTAGPVCVGRQRAIEVMVYDRRASRPTASNFGTRMHTGTQTAVERLPSR